MTIIKKINGVSKNILKGNIELGQPDHPAAVLGSGIENSLDMESDRAMIAHDGLSFQER